MGERERERVCETEYYYDSNLIILIPFIIARFPKSILAFVLAFGFYRIWYRFNSFTAHIHSMPHVSLFISVSAHSHCSR